MATRKLQPKKLNTNQCIMLRRRGLDPKNYVVIKDTYTTLYLRDIRDGSIKLISKYN